jgi:hypothetical protein
LRHLCADSPLLICGWCRILGLFMWCRGG